MLSLFQTFSDCTSMSHSVGWILQKVIIESNIDSKVIVILLVDLHSSLSLIVATDFIQ